MNKLILPFLLLAVGLSSTVQAEIYKWTDSDGKTHYSATPPQDSSAKAEQIGEKIKFNVGKVKSSEEKDDEPEQTATPAAEEEADKAPRKNIYKGDRSPARLAYCKNLENNIHILENNENANIIEEGGTEPLGTDERNLRLTQAKEKLAKNCEDISS